MVAQPAPTVALPAGRRAAGWLLPVAGGLAAYASVLGRGGGVFGDPDPFYHVAVGRWIIAHGAVPRADPFSFSLPGAPWVAHEWLGELMFAVLHRAFGWGGLLFTAAALLAIAIGLLIAALRRHVGDAIALVGALSAWGLCFPHLLARPHVFALPLLVVWVAALDEARAAERAPPLPLALLLTLWANLHGSYMLALGLAALFAGEAVFEAATPRAALVALRRWGVFGALAAGAALVTPNGLPGVVLPFEMARLDFALSWVNEWQSPNFQAMHPLEGWLLLVLLGALTLGVRLPVTRIAMLLVLLHLALTHQRHGEILGLAAPLLVARALAPQLGAHLAAPEMARLGRVLAARLAPATARRIGLAAVVLVAALASALRLPNPDISSPFTPQAALAAVRARGVTGHVFNEFNYGGYLIYSGIAPFVDGRIDMYRDVFLQRYSKLSELPGLLQQYDISWTLLDPKRERAALMDHLPGWTRLYADDIAVVHVRTGAAAR